MSGLKRLPGYVMIIFIFMLIILRVHHPINLFPVPYWGVLMYLPIIFGSIFALLFFKKIHMSITQTLYISFVTLLFIFALLGSTWSIIPQMSFQRSLTYVSPMLIICYLVYLDNRPYCTFSNISLSVGILGGLLSIYGFAILIFGEHMPMYTQNGDVLGDFYILDLGIIVLTQQTVGSAPFIRLGSMIGNPNSLGGILMITTLLTFGQKFIRNNKNIRLVNFLIVLQTAGLIFTFSRGAIFSTVVGIIVFYWYIKKYKNLIFISVATIPVFILFNMFVTSSASSTVNWAVSGRFEMWKIVFDSFLQRPLLGHGFGITAGGYFPEGLGRNPHNSHIRVLGEMGIIGFIIYIFVWAIPLISGIKKRFTDSKDNVIVLYGIATATLIALLFHSTFEGSVLRFTVRHFLWAYILAFLTVTSTFATSRTV